MKWGRCAGRPALPRVATKMTELAGVAFQVGFNLAQARRPRKLCMQHRDQMSPWS
jgi:hypothetical protein